MLIRQGDLALIPTAPPSSPVPDPRLLTLAIDEDYGHMHQIAGSLVGDVLVVPDAADLVIGPATSAWRHDPIAVPAGSYRAIVQREYTPAGAREVGD